MLQEMSRSHPSQKLGESRNKWNVCGGGVVGDQEGESDLSLSPLTCNLGKWSVGNDLGWVGNVNVV